MRIKLKLRENYIGTKFIVSELGKITYTIVEMIDDTYTIRWVNPDTNEEKNTQYQKESVEKLFKKAVWKRV